MRIVCMLNIHQHYWNQYMLLICFSNIYLLILCYFHILNHMVQNFNINKWWIFLWITCISIFLLLKKYFPIHLFRVFLCICDYKLCHSLLQSPFLLKLCTIAFGDFLTSFFELMYTSFHETKKKSIFFLSHKKAWTIMIVFYNDFQVFYVKWHPMDSFTMLISFMIFNVMFNNEFYYKNVVQWLKLCLVFIEHWITMNVCWSWR